MRIVAIELTNQILFGAIGNPMRLLESKRDQRRLAPG